MRSCVAGAFQGKEGGEKGEKQYQANQGRGKERCGIQPAPPFFPYACFAGLTDNF